MLERQSVQQRFTRIYKSNYWGSNESRSGAGSTLEYTENLRKELPLLIRELGVRRVFDAPCGDFNWMKEVLPRVDIEYVGGDIVIDIVSALNSQYANERTAFVQLDLTAGLFPDADLMICRDCLFHLSYSDTLSVLKNFVRSEISYLLTTTHKATMNFHNRDITTGDFRLIDLFAAPYHLPPNPLARIDDWLPPGSQRELCLWNREQVILAVSSFESGLR